MYGAGSGNLDVYNPPIPYMGCIPVRVVNGTIISVDGFVPHGSASFSINIKEGDTYLFHFNPRFTERCIVRNTCIGSWGKEERHGGLPLLTGKRFNLIVLVEDGCFRIAVNGTHFTDYVHRYPKENANLLTVEGTVVVEHIKFQPPQLPMNNYTGIFAPPPANPQAGMAPRTLSIPKVPLMEYIQGGLTVGKSITLSGIPAHNGQRFYINLMTDRSKSTIAFHFDVRHNFGSQGRDTVVCNTCIQGQWQSEQLHVKSKPFRPGHRFDLMIRVETSSFEVYVNGQHFCSHPHRIPYQTVTMLYVEGDVTLSSVVF